MWAAEDGCCALQAYLDCNFRNLAESQAQERLTSLAIGVHGQALGYGIHEYDAHYLSLKEDDPSIAIYWTRPEQPYCGPFYEFYFLTCEELTLVPYPVWREITQIAVAHHLAFAGIADTQEARNIHNEDFRIQFKLLGISMEIRQMEEFRIGIFGSGTRRYVRILNPEFAALNWLYFYMECMKVPFNHAMQSIQNGISFEADGIACHRIDGAISILETAPFWIISVEWEEDPVVIAQDQLLRVLTFMMQVD